MILVSVLKALAESRSIVTDYPTSVRNSRSRRIYRLEEDLPKIEKRQFLKDKVYSWGRIAIGLNFINEPVYTVYQPRWLSPLEEELEAVSPNLISKPPIITDYVIATWDFYDAVIETGQLVPEVQTELAESRQRYWTAKHALVTGEKESSIFQLERENTAIQQS